MKQVLKLAIKESNVKFKNSQLMRKLMNDIEKDNELVIRLQNAINDHKEDIWNLRVVDALQFLIKECDIQDLPLMWL